jgi:germination protein M
MSQLPRRPAGRAVGGLLAGSLVAALAGCGLPSASTPHQPAGPVPFSLLAPTLPARTATPVPGPAVRIYLVRRNHLVPATRHAVGDNLPADALRLLLAGPTAREAASGKTTDIPAGTRLVSLDLRGSIATVDVSSPFGNVGGSSQVLAVAQIVWTLTASKYIDTVRFVLNGKRIEVPNGSGSLSAKGRSRADFRKVAPVTN